MTGSKENCRTCGKPKSKAAGSGFVTSFIDICQCDFIVDGEEEPGLICTVCKLKIKAEKKGSMTQWIFQAGYCSCDKPQPQHIEAKEYKQAKFAGYDAFEEEEFLELNPETYPVERYKPIKELGRGASGSVYLARDQLLRTLVAVKVLHSLRDDLLVSFQDEARSTSKLDHPNIIKILDFGSSQSGMIPIMVLEFFDGISLDAYIAEHGPIEQTKACRLFALIADGLAYAHSKGIFHRDIKPSNILVGDLMNENIQVKIIDFGIAKVTQATSQPIEFQNKSIAGTPGFMSPDQITGFGFDERSEIYSLACVLFKTLCGNEPFEAESPLEILALQTNGEPPDIETIDPGTTYNGNLSSLLKSCLALDPEERVQSMEEFAQTLLEISQEPVPLQQSNELSKTNKSNSRLILFSTILLLACSLASLLLMRSDLFQTPEQETKPHKSKKPTVSSPLLKVTDDASALLSSKSRLIKFRGPPGYDTYILEDSKNRLPDLKELDEKNSKVNLMLKLSFMDTDAMNKVLAVKSLKGLGISIHSGITDDTIKLLLKRPDLEIIQIVDGGKLSKNSYALLKALPHLTQLDLDNCDLTLPKVEQIADLKSLEVLTIKYDKKLDKKALDLLLSNLKKITYLNLMGSSVTDESLSTFAKAKELNDLSLAFTGITDNGINALVKSRCPATDLDLSGTKITRKGLLQLGKLPHLKYLTVRNTPNINKHEIEILKKSVSFEITDVVYTGKFLE